MRLKHYRGRGIHSPLVYGIVRECLMPCAGKPAEEQIKALFDYLAGHPTCRGEVFCMVSRRGNRHTRKEIVGAHPGTSFETRKFLCTFTDRRLPKQHFKL